MRVGPYQGVNNLILAPMAGVTDRPFRQLCRREGAGLAVSEMVTAKASLRNSAKTRRRLDHRGESGPRWVQIVGADPRQLAEAARFNVDHGAQIIDINMGCPAKKVCNVAAGSALLRDEALVGRILEAVVAAVPVPVTLKIRTGWCPRSRNAVSVARIAEQAGIQSLAVHGRTRACGYKGMAEYDTIKAVKQAVSLPVAANGDITGPEKAREVLAYTGADAVMIGRGAQGRPWLFRQIQHYLETGTRLPEPGTDAVSRLIKQHLQDIYQFYGEYSGVRIARKHIGWYCKGRPGGDAFCKTVNRVDSPEQQLAMVESFFAHMLEQEEKAA